MKITAAVLITALAAAGCGDPAGSPPPTAEVPTITGSELVAGGDGWLRGTHLDKLVGTILVDGTAVTPTAASPAEIRFSMPASRGPCDVDGRQVRVQAGSLTHDGQLRVPNALQMQVGESRVLSRSGLATACVQLPAGDERYVLTVVNTELTPSGGPDALITVRSWTGADAAAGTSLHLSSRNERLTELPQGTGFATTGAHGYAANPVPFDARYSTAEPGDTLPWVDWWGAAYPDCAGPREQVPTIPIVVAAVSGKTVIAFDARSPRSAEWASAATRARLSRMAEMMDRWAVPAVREVMDPAYAPVTGAGGRWFHVFRSDVPGWTADNNDAPQTACRYASEVPSTIAPDLPPANDAQAGYFAGLAIHEYGHHAEIVYRIRRWGSTTPPGRVSATWGSLGEAWAQTVQETAARLASGQPTGARYGPLEVTGSAVPYADFYLNGYGETPEQSPWTVTTGGNRGGYYDQGTRLLMFLRERWGDAPLGAPRERFFPRVQELPHYDLGAIAALLGMSADSVLDMWSLAEATDDLVDPAAAAQAGLPQIATWVPHDAGPLPSLMVPRTRDETRTLAAGRGNYAALYLFANGRDAGKGVSVTFENVGTARLIARITRVR